MFDPRTRCKISSYAFLTSPCKLLSALGAPVCVSSQVGTGRKQCGIHSFKPLKGHSKKFPHKGACTGSLRMAVDPWSVSPATIDTFASKAFAASLFPYLGFLYYIGKDESQCPKLANYGFRFLLVFVATSIPAGIYSKVHYGEILANVDWLHGGAESLLTITNLLVVLGMRSALAEAQGTSAIDAKPVERSTSAKKRLQRYGVSIALITILSFVPFPLPTTHAEPSNALSLLTWIIHVSSIVEWLAAMGLMWQYADLTQNNRWKGLTWGMLPLHISGICACTFHLFYNAPALNLLVAIQACLTVFGNSTMCLAAYRIYWNVAEVEREKSFSTTVEGMSGNQMPSEATGDFLGNILLTSTIAAAAIKWGELYLDAPFHPSLGLALGVIALPSGLNVLKWGTRSVEASK